jgi:DNA helicase-2/ATP-dependent DNA helicase PcrA
MDLFSQATKKQQFDQGFQKALKRLNTEQRSAVEAIEGPVMVIAGPGTGKTHILGVRIGNILRKTDIAPHNILCLTFTDAATIAMRKRLVEIIGPEGHKVHIYTFHGFCNQVIQENLGIFGNYRQLEPISDLEKVDVFDEIINDLPKDHILKRLKGDPRYEAKRMSNLFDLMKKENLNVDDINHKVDLYLEQKRDSDDFIAKRKTTLRKTGKTFLKGDFREDKFEDLKKAFEELRHAAVLFDKYQNIMDRMGRYDYNDMILWVLKAFEKDDELLGKYQERYQYFLVDEYQDTNGAQNRILDLLIHFMDYTPNAFVVGDDDQAIYKFQGANLNNIKDFKKENNPELIVLEKNYRSNQNILDASTALISFNTERIVNDNDLELNKNLIASGEAKDKIRDPDILVYDNIVHEQADLANTIEKLYNDGADLNEIAVIYRKHSQVSKLVEVLEKKNIPINIRKKIDILKIPLIDNILNILYYILSEYEKPDSAEHRLFELMHYHFFHINSRDIAKIALFLQNRREAQRLAWKDVIAERNILEELKVKTLSDISILNDLIDKWVADIANVTLQILFENILNEGHILQSILKHPDKTWLLQVLSTFFDYIKEETNKNPSLNLKEFLGMIDKMKEAEIPLEINKTINSEKGIHFVTAHSAKGLEFEKVYLIGCTKEIWDKNMRNNFQYKYPDNVNEDVQTNTEDERRLFFVAMTRAKSKLVISYSLQRESGKETSASQFVDEILANTLLQSQKKAVAINCIEDFQYQILLKQSKEIKLIDNDLIDRVLERYKLSVTGLNKYLKCPMSFYFETILKVPTARNKHMGFGRAIHTAFQLFFEDLNNKKEGSKDSLISYFTKGMKAHKSHFTTKEYEDMMAYGEMTLEKYYNFYFSDPQLPKAYHLEYKIDNAEYHGVPIKGVLDKVEIFENYVNVSDYKTGSFEKTDTRNKLKAPFETMPEGGDYWRQIVFYKILLDSDKKYNWDMTSGDIDFIEPGKKSGEFLRKKLVVSGPEIEIVGEQIKEAWKDIHNHKFNQLCEDERCYWCNFVRNDYVFSEELELDLLEEIYDE